MAARLVLALLAVAISAACTRAADDPVLPSTAPQTTSAATPTHRTSPVQTRTPASSAPVPPVSAEARAAGLVDVRTVVPDAIVDLRYATEDNFVGERLYPPDARCLVHRSLAPGLTAAARQLRRTGDVLVFWDCYRPHAVQVRMFQAVPDSSWVAAPGPYAISHEAARSVDVTLARARCSPALRCLRDMGTGFDEFTPRANAFATDGISARAQANRARLRAAMTAGGLTVYAGEWWHFDGPGALDPRPHLDVPLT